MDEIVKEIKKYKLDVLLQLLAELSRELFLQRNFTKEIEWKKYSSGMQQNFKQLLPAWGLSDISYLAILYSNDYRSITPSKDNIYRLNNLLIQAGNNIAKIRKNEVSTEDMKIHILFGLSQKQFWYQEIIRNRVVYYNFLRNYILLHEMPKFFPMYKMPDDDLLEITGFNIKSFSQLLFALWAYNINVSPLLKIGVSDELKNNIPIITEDNLKKCVGFFSADYKYLRQPHFPNNPLFFKPIIRTDTNKLIVSNSFIWARKVFEGIYWIIRDSYCQQTFINNFGEYYERYIQEVLAFYLKSGKYEKIRANNDDKCADWLIFSEEYILVVEQKSCLMTIALKDEYPSLKKLDDFLDKFKEAYLQIAETANTVKTDGKIIIKLILHFEKLYLGEAVIKERVALLCKNEIDDMANYFLIETEEFEKLVQVLADDEDTFNEIIKTKINYENNVPISEGIEFNPIIDKHAELTGVKYLDSYRHIFEELFERAF